MVAPNDSEAQEAGNGSESQYLHLKEVEITFKGNRPKNKLMLVLDVQGDRRYKSNVLGQSGDIRWKNDLYLKPTAIAKLNLELVHGTDFKLKLTRDYASVDLDLAKYGAAVTNNGIILEEHPKIRVKLNFADPISLHTIVRLLSIDASSALASKVEFLDKIDRMLSFTKFVLELGEIAGQAGFFASVVSASARMAFDRCQAITEVHQIAVDLVDDMVSILPVPDMLRGRIQESETRKQLMGFLELIKDTMDVLTQYAAHSTSGFYLRNWFNSKQDVFVRLKHRLESMKQNTDLFLGASTYLLASRVHDSTKEVQKAVIDVRDLQLLDRLCPVKEAMYDPDRGCLEGTRMKFLDDIFTKVKNAETKLCWVYGVAGSGKSTVSVSVAAHADKERMLGGCFSFQRDIPELRAPRRILPALSQSLSKAYAPYRKHVLSVLASDEDIVAKAPKLQLQALFGKDLPIEVPKTPYVFVIDALDECGDEQDRTTIGACLRQLTQNIPWLKVVVTSRPTYEIQQAFEEPEESEEGQSEQHQAMVSFDLNAADDVESDIYKYNETWLKRVRKLLKKWRQPEWLRILTQRACGLFIWSSTVAKYVSDALDCNIALERVLDQTSAPAKGPFDTLDELYRFVLEQVQGDRLIIKKALGILVCTAKHRPLTLRGLYDLMPAGSIDEGLSYTALETILERLQSVLYTDASAGEVVRVCHPSFLDFMSAKERAGSFWSDPSEVNAELYRRCMHMMDKGLKFNICKLESAYLLNAEIPNLQKIILANVPAAMQYGCIYWIDHLLEAGHIYDMQDPSVQVTIARLLCDIKCLFWLEILSLLKELKAGMNALGYCLQAYQLPNKIAVASADLFKFTSGFYDVLNSSTPHIYISALSWAPSDSYIYKELSTKFFDKPIIISGKARRWKPVLWSTMASGAFVRVKFSPDGKFVASAMTDVGTGEGFLLLWNIQSGEVVGEPFARIENTIYHVKRVEFSPDGKNLAVCTGNGELTFWDTVTRKRMANELKEGATNVTCFKYSPLGDAFVAASSNTFRVWNMQTGDLAFGSVTTDDFLTCLCYSPDSSYIVTGSRDGQVCVWHAQSGQPIGRPLADGHTDYVQEIEFSPDGRFFCSVSNDETLRLWNTKEWQLVQTATVTSEICALSYTPDGRYVITSCTDGQIYFWEVLEDGQDVTLIAHRLGGSYGLYPCFACSLDGRHLVMGSVDKTMRLWDVNAILEFEESDNIGNGHTSDIETIDYLPDGKVIMSASGDRSIRFWDSDTGEMFGKPISGAHSQATYSPDGKFVVSCGGIDSVRIWDAKTRDLVKTLATPENSKKFECAQYSHDGRYIVGYSDHEGKIFVWDGRSGELLGDSGDAFKPKTLNSLEKSPSANHVIIMTDEAQTIYDIETNKPVLSLAEGALLSFAYYSQDGKTIARGYKNNLYLHDSKTGDALGEPLAVDDTDVIMLGTFSPTDRYLGLSSMDRKIRILDLKNKKVAAGPFSGHSELIGAIKYSPDGRYIATGSTDDTIRIWDTELLMKNADRQRDAIISIFTDGSFEVGIEKGNEQGQTQTLENKTIARRVLPERVAEDGWYRNAEGKLLFWIPPDYRIDAVDMSKICIPPSARRELDYDFELLSRFEGKLWANIYSG